MAEAYKSPRRSTGRRDAPAPPGTPAAARELRAQGRKTMRKLLDAGMRVFAERGFHAARVDDIVRAARTSHGTFYLYFANKEELLRALAIQCAHEMGALAGGLGEVQADAAGAAELRRFLETFFSTYARFGPVLRAWMEGNVEDRETSQLGVVAFTDIAAALGARMRDAGARGDPATVAALMALLERFAYFLVSRQLEFDSDALFDTVTLVVHRGFFGAPLAA
ncbi:MAG TPA: helix-turn-helix domain-containing protein [Acidimicrobiia bacterium]|jgi:AcrR family transcriptional regulator|nr:helix-turn-helix domain-containing protein [Acidimicrobiia bacterium]